MICDVPLMSAEKTVSLLSLQRAVAFWENMCVHMCVHAPTVYEPVFVLVSKHLCIWAALQCQTQCCSSLAQCYISLTEADMLLCTLAALTDVYNQTHWAKSSQSLQCQPNKLNRGQTTTQPLQRNYNRLNQTTPKQKYKRTDSHNQFNTN